MQSMASRIETLAHPEVPSAQGSPSSASSTDKLPFFISKYSGSSTQPSEPSSQRIHATTLCTSARLQPAAVQSSHVVSNLSVDAYSMASEVSITTTKNWAYAHAPELASGQPAMSISETSNESSSLANGPKAPTLAVQAEDGFLIEDTAQLVLCARLLASKRHGPPLSPSPIQPSSNSTFGGSNIPQDCVQLMNDNPLDKEHLYRLMSRIVEKFEQQPTKDPDSIREVVLVGPMLDREHFSRLVKIFIGDLEKTSVKSIDILIGLVQLVQDAPAKCLKQEDLTRIVWLSTQLLQDSTEKDTRDTIYLAMATTVLLSTTMTSLESNQGQGLLRKVFSSLRHHKEPLVRVQAKYADQVLRSVPRQSTVTDHKTIYRLRSIFKKIKRVLGSSDQPHWFQDVRKAGEYTKDYQFSDLKRLIYKSPNLGNANFQWRVCLLLGEITLDPTWTSDDRDQAAAILYGFVKTNKQDPMIRRWALTILAYISESPAVLCIHGALNLSTGFDAARSSNARNLVREFKTTGLQPFDFVYPLTGRLPLPASSPLFQKVSADPDVEYAIGCLRRQRSGMFDKRAVYIQLLSKQSLRSSEDALVALQERTRDFMKSRREVLLVLGDSGAGKSTFGMRLEHELWDAYKPGGPIPIFIDLKSIDTPDKNMIQQHLEDQGYFSDEQIEELRQSRRFILICDGYDECHRWINLHTKNYLNKPRQWQAQMIVSCRTQYLGPNYRNYFEPEVSTAVNNLNFSDTSDLYEEAVIVPFRSSQIREYVELFTQAPRNPDHLGDGPMWTVEQYMERLRSIGHLMELAQNPFMLRMIMDVLPRIAKTTIKITRVDLYDHFVELHFESEQRRLSNQHSIGKVDKDTLSAFKSLQNDELIHLGLDFSKKLSYCIFKEQGGLNSITYSTMLDNESWKDGFFGSDARAKLLRESAQLVCRENRQDTRRLIRHGIRMARKRNSYEFSHRSILEYFYSCMVFDPKGNAPSLDLAVCLDSSGNPEPIVNHPLGQIGIVSETSIVNFLAERVQQHYGFRNQLQTIVGMSKDKTTVSQAAANSITILAKAGHYFNEANLQGIRIPGADLSEGRFDSAQLQRANLTGVRLKMTWLRQADLSEATMTNVRFGEKPFVNVPEPWCVGISPDGKMLAAGLQEGDVHIYDTFDSCQLFTFKGHSAYVASAVFSSDNSLVVSGSDDRTVRVWHLNGGKDRVFEGHTGGVHVVAIAPASKHVASASFDGTARIWNIESGSCVHILNTSLRRQPALAWSPCGHQVVTGALVGSGDLKLWNADTGELDRTLDAKLVLSTVYSRQGKLLVVGHPDTLFIWDLNSDKEGDKPMIVKGPGNFSNATFSQDEQMVAVACNDGSIHLYDAVSGSFVTSLKSHYGFVLAVAFLKNQELISAAQDGTIRFWQLNEELAPRENAFSVSMAEKRGHEHAAHSLVYISNGDFILSGGIDGILQWDTETGDCRQYLEDAAKTMAISPNGKQLAVGRNDLRIYELSETNEPKEDRRFDRVVGDVTYSPCGRWMAAVEDKKGVRLWDLRYKDDSGRALKGYTASVLQLTFSPSGHQLVAVVLHAPICLWDTESATLMQVPEISGSAASFSPCGSVLAIGDSESLHLWNLREKDTTLFAELESDANCMVWSPCGVWLAAGFPDGALRLWKMSNNGSVFMASNVISVRDISEPVSCLTWSPTDPLKFATGSMTGYICVWRIAKVKKDAYRLQSVWDSFPNRLTAFGTRLDGVIGLTEMQKKLLRQRGAIEGSDVPVMEQTVGAMGFTGKFIN
ncbi:hypothetical protein EMPS_08472 [Entomortierella parvispora]|uniref:NACHT domain-containing protein n=1 Tax=Entomortierella parvispora TaxID=205924 RepID=A0A9P3HGR1_9FUNG|nr:hypothetical protein EMPS_08472 [Entomortierella parvispora]